MGGGRDDVDRAWGSAAIRLASSGSMASALLIATTWPGQQLGRSTAPVRRAALRAARRGTLLQWVEQHHQRPGPLDVAEELVPQSFPLGGALDQPGDVGQYELAVVDLDHAEMWLERGERVVGHLGGRAAETAEISVLFPALGNPTRAASASSFISRTSRVTSPYSPCSA